MTERAQLEDVGLDLAQRAAWSACRAHSVWIGHTGCLNGLCNITREEKRINPLFECGHVQRLGGRGRKRNGAICIEPLPQHAEQVSGGQRRRHRLRNQVSCLLIGGGELMLADDKFLGCMWIGRGPR